MYMKGVQSYNGNKSCGHQTRFVDENTAGQITINGGPPREPINGTELSRLSANTQQSHDAFVQRAIVLSIPRTHRQGRCFS